ncbi:hypothetical protein ACD489_005391, partial [Escherichia coli]
KWFCLHTTTTPIKDLSGNDIPADNYVFIKNANNQTFYITQESAEGGIKYKAVTTDSGEYGFQRQREAIWSNVITIAQKSDGEDQFNRIIAASKSGSGKNQDKILVVDQQASEGNNTLVIGGGSSVFRSATVIDFATNQDANATGGEKRWRIDSSGNLRPYTDNTYSIGYASWRPAQVYSATGSISTSDRTHKQDETILSDAEKRVARKLLG